MTGPFYACQPYGPNGPAVAVDASACTRGASACACGCGPHSLAPCAVANIQATHSFPTAFPIATVPADVHGRRVSELLEANNREVERRREAERKLREALLLVDAVNRCLSRDDAERAQAIARELAR